jgi:hypothetical protein
MTLVKDNNSERPHKAIAVLKLLCSCPNSEPGKINLDICAHESDCWVRKRLLTKRYTVDTSVIPEKFNDGYSLGVVLSEENY